MSEKKLLIPYLCCLVFFLIEIILGAFQLYERDFVCANGSFINPGPFSCFLALMIPLFIRIYQWNVNQSTKGICGAAILLGVLFIPYQLSRTAIISGIIGSLFVLLLPYVGTRSIFRSKRFLGALSVINALSFIAFLVAIK